MSHKMHSCSSKFAPDIIASLRSNHGWPHDKIPLNVEMNKRTGVTKHETCPYCGLESSKFEDVPVEDVVALGINQKASGYARTQRQPGKTAGDQAILAELRAMRAKIEKLEGKK